MKRWTSLLVACCLPLLAAEEETAPEPDGVPVLRGVLDLGEHKAFSLSTEGGTQASWVELGRSYRGFELSGYDAARQVLTLSRDGETVELVLAAAAEPEGGPGTMEERLAEADRVMQAMQFQESIRLALDAQMDSMSDMMRQQMARFDPGGAVDEELIAFQAQATREMFEEMDWEAIEKGMAEAYAEVFTSEELRGMVDFYATPAGRASIEKMPEVQQKTMRVMMPAIMEASAGMQEKLQAFMEDREGGGPQE
jgi:hypothetical protein